MLRSNKPEPQKGGSWLGVARALQRNHLGVMEGKVKGVRSLASKDVGFRIARVRNALEQLADAGND